MSEKIQFSSSVDKVVEDYEFKNFSKVISDSHKVKDFQFDDIYHPSRSSEEVKDKIATIERYRERKGEFQIASIVKKYRGLQEHEDKEKEQLIQIEVNKRVEEITEEAYKVGYDEGVKMGREEVYNQTKAAAEEKIGALTAMIADVLQNQEEILNQQKDQIFTMVRNLSKWVILKELENDGEYLQRLLEKLILETQTKTNLLIQVNQKSFEFMPEVLEKVQEKLGELSNVRVEVDYDIHDKGIIVDSENGIVDGSLKEQFKNLDKLFESVGLDDNEPTS